jgi:hypothetical protein
VAGLIIGPDGGLYGTTRGGGTGTNPFTGGGRDTVFKLTAPRGPGSTWTERVLYNFCYPGCADGSQLLAGLIFDRSGTLYGTTSDAESTLGGVGTAFELKIGAS